MADRDRIRTDEKARIRQIEETSQQIEVLRTLGNAIEKKSQICISLFFNVDDHEIELLRCRPIDESSDE